MKKKTRPCKKVNVIGIPSNDSTSDTSVVARNNIQICDVMRVGDVEVSHVLDGPEVGRKRFFDDVLESTIDRNKRRRGGIESGDVMHVGNVKVSDVLDAREDVDDDVTLHECRHPLINSRLKRKFEFGNSSADMDINNMRHIKGKKMAVDAFIPIFDETTVGLVGSPVTDIMLTGEAVGVTMTESCGPPLPVTLAEPPAPTVNISTNLGLTAMEESCDVPPPVISGEPSGPAVNVSTSLGVTQEDWLKGLDAIGYLRGPLVLDFSNNSVQYGAPEDLLTARDVTAVVGLSNRHGSHSVCQSARDTCPEDFGIAGTFEGVIDLDFQGNTVHFVPSSSSQNPPAANTHRCTYGRDTPVNIEPSVQQRGQTPEFATPSVEREHPTSIGHPVFGTGPPKES